MQTFTNVIVNKMCSDKRFTSLATGCVQTFTIVIVNKMCYDKRFLQKVPIVDDRVCKRLRMLLQTFTIVIVNKMCYDKRFLQKVPIVDGHAVLMTHCCCKQNVL